MNDKDIEIYKGKPFVIEDGKNRPPDLVTYNGESLLLYQCPGCKKGFYVRSGIFFFMPPWCGKCGYPVDS